MRNVARYLLVSVAVVAVGWFVYEKMRQTSEASKWTMHTMEVMTSVNRIKMLTHDLELSGDRPVNRPADTKQIRRAKDRLQAFVQDFRQLTADNPNQAVNADNFDTAVASGDADQVADILAGMVDEERRLIVVRQARMDDARNTLALVFAGMAAGVVVALWAAFFQGARWSERQQARKLNSFIETIPGSEARMPLTPQEAFKVGFLQRCVQDGLSPDQMLARVKQASDMLEKRAFLGELAGGIAGAGKTLAGYGIPLALAAPPILGGLGGYALAKATDVDDTDVDAIKNQELVDEYRRQTARMTRQNSVRQYAKQQKPSGRALI